MDLITKTLWLIPALPLVTSAAIALLGKADKRRASTLAISAMGVSFLISLVAFVTTLGKHGEAARRVFNFDWFQFGGEFLQIGWVLDPLTAAMLMMVTFVGTLIFIYSVGYMADDENSKQFFCFLSLFAAAMLGVVIANSLLLLFICWELVGLTSYLLIGFWFHKPEAAAAAKKAFITTRIGDLGLLIGMVWLYAESGTLLFYDGGNGCLEQTALVRLATQTTAVGMMVSTAIGLLIFLGAVGKSGQLPLHVWLPDAMEGPTPVSALIHAATMVAAGVFLVARMYPLMSAGSLAGDGVPVTPTLTVITWVGAVTALFSASIAVAQNDIKRILAYSTVSQLGYMMMGLGLGGVAVGMFHLITHAFFKALLFMGAGSVIHGCHHEQDIRRMGGIKRFMPVTFATYMVGMLALAGFPLVFSGFWSKDEILHAAHLWSVSHWPFYLGLVGAFLTAFYMTRQIMLVFYGYYRGNDGKADTEDRIKPHESPAVMTRPLVVLAVCTVLLGLFGTPAWPWFQSFLGGEAAHFIIGKLFSAEFLLLAVKSSFVVFAGIGVGCFFYGLWPMQKADEVDPLEKSRPDLFGLVKNKYFIDELYELTVIRFNAWFAHLCDMLDRWVWNGVVQLVSYVILGLAWVNRVIDEFVINLGFNMGCKGLQESGDGFSRFQSGQVQLYLRVIGIAFVGLLIVLMWGRAS